MVPLSLAAKAPAPIYTEADIGLYLADDKQSQFYDVWVDQDENPYLNVEDILVNWLGFKASCQVAQKSCQGSLPPHQQLVWINGKKQQMSFAGRSHAIPPGALIVRGQRLWLKYKVWSHWLPMKMTWSLQHYQLTMHPFFQLPADWLAEQKQAVAAEWARQQSQRMDKQQSWHYPAANMNWENRYRLDWSVDQDLHSELGAATEADLDIGQGTFYLAAELGSARATGDERQAYWHYSMTHPGVYHLIRLGDTEVNNTLLLPYLELTQAFQFQRLPPNQGSGDGFVTVGHTMPGTEVDVYRNGVLIATQIASSDGAYRIHLPETVAGDRFKVQYYYQDGSYQTREWVIANDYGLMLKNGQHDWQMATGVLNVSGHPRYNQLSWRMGLPAHTTLGLSLLRLPTASSESVDAGMLDWDWQPLRWLTLLAEGLHTEQSDDYLLQADMTRWASQDWRFKWTHITDDSPIVYLQNQSVSETLTPYASNQSWSLADIISWRTWRIVPQWTADRSERTMDVTASGRLSEKLSSSAELGYSSAMSEGGQNQWFSNVSMNYQFAQGQLLLLSRTMASATTASNGISYRLQGNGWNQYDASVGLTIPDQGQISLSGSLSWRAHRHWRLAVNFDNSTVALELSFQGLFGQSWRQRSYSDFSTGSVAGTIYAPARAGQDPEPLSGVQVEAGGVRAVTDAHGHYFIAGVETNRPVTIKVDSKSLDADYVLDKPAITAWLRPATIIEYSPKLDWLGGVDGTFLTHRPIPSQAIVKVVDVHSQQVAAIAPVDSDGFFVVDGLRMGNYELEVDTPDGRKLSQQRIRLTDKHAWLSRLQVVDGEHQLAEQAKEPARA
jgi:hypothetical protein